MPSLYTFTDYSPDWPSEFAREAGRLQILLGDNLVTVHHVGSTSVPGLAAKPVIDLLPLVLSVTRVDASTALFQGAGYKAWGEYGLPGRRFFTKDCGEHRTHNIHIYQTGDPDVERHIAFCAYLRAHKDHCRDYENLKREVYSQYPADIAAYNAGKSTWIKRVEKLALAWYRQRDA
ncbi:MAG: GrpB family protein [Candidatus Schekmanbacteria bacterium]|nr:GrpB family protein [Candidatus Schekmanbacteria bacterium]